MKFLIVSEHGDGAAVAHRLLAEGNDVRLYLKAVWSRPILAGIVQQVKSIREGLFWQPDVVLFDMAGMGKEADKLRSEGWNVLGGGKWNDRLELDRGFSAKTMKTFGIRSPESYMFDSMKEALRFVSEHPKRLVLKPCGNKDTSYTYVGKSQDDLMSFMGWLKRTKNVDGKILLQEHIHGAEISTEVWFANGVPISNPNGTIECKKLLHGDAGPSTGSESSLVWFYPKKEPRIVQQSLKKMYVFMEHIKYTGPIDINGIVRNGRFYGLEFSPRMGYSAISALMQVLDEDLGAVLYRVATGDSKAFKYKKGFGFSMRASIPPYPYKSEKLSENKALYDSTKGLMVGGIRKSDWGRTVLGLDVRESNLGVVTAGIDGAVLDICSFGEDIYECEMKATEIFKKLELPNKQARLGDATKIASRRLFDLESMGYEVPPLFEQLKVTKGVAVQTLAIAPAVEEKKEEKEEKKHEKVKDDRLAIANTIGCRPGAIASPIERGRTG